MSFYTEQRSGEKKVLARLMTPKGYWKHIEKKYISHQMNEKASYS